MQPILGFALQCGIIATFKTYPSYGDLMLYVQLILLFGNRLGCLDCVPFRRRPGLTHLPDLRRTFIFVNMFLASVVLGPIFYHLWINLGSGNANFFYAINLVFALAQGFLLVDCFRMGIVSEIKSRMPGIDVDAVNLK